MAILFGIGKLRQHHHRFNGFVRVPIQTGQCLALVENRKAEFDMFENPSIFLTFRENFYALKLFMKVFFSRSVNWSYSLSK